MKRFFDSPRCMVWLIVVAAALSYVAALEPHLQGGGDDVYYLAVAKSLLLGKGFASGHLVGSPADTYHTPLFPLTLAGLYRFFPNDYAFLKLASLIPTLLSIYLAFELALPYVGPRRATLLSLCFAFNPLVFRATQDILTEPLFTAFSTAALLCLRRYSQARSDLGWPFWGTVLLAGAAYYTRSMGLPLLAAAVLYLAVQKKWQKAILVGGSLALLVAPWLLRGYLLGPPSELQLTYAPFYLVQDPTDPHSAAITLPTLALRVLRKGIGYLVRELPALIAWPDFFAQVSLVNFRPTFWPIMALGLLLSMPVLVGYLRGIRRGWWLLGLYVPLYFAPLVACSFSSPRFLVPLSPILLLFWIEGVPSLLSPRWSRLALIAVLALALVCDVAELRRAHTLEIPTRQEWQLVAWLAENTSPEAVLMGEPVGLLYLHTGRQGVPLWGKLTQPEILARIGRYGVTHVALYAAASGVQDAASSQTTANLAAVIRRHAERFVLCYQNEQFTLYAVQTP